MTAKSYFGMRKKNEKFCDYSDIRKASHEQIVRVSTLLMKKIYEWKFLRG